MAKNLVLILFTATCIATAWIGYSNKLTYTLNQKKLENVKIKSESFFSKFTLFLSNSKGPVVSVKGSEMVVDHQDNQILFFSPIGKMKKSGSNSFFDYTAGRGHFDGNNNDITLKDNVHFFEPGFDFKGERLSYSFDDEKAKGEGNVAVVVKHRKTGDFLTVNSDSFEGNMTNKIYQFRRKVVGVIKRKRQFEDSINFKSEKLSIDESEGLMKLDENVVLNQRSIEALANNGEIFLENYNKKLKYYVLKDDVRLKEVIKLKNGKSLLRKAFAEQLEGQMKMRQIVLSGFPKVIQSGSVLTGNTIILKENQKVIEVQDANSNFRIGNGN